MSAARSFEVVVDLLDRQIVDRDGRLAGNVDDAELTIHTDGRAYLTALLSGPGILAERVGWRRYGRWRQTMERTLEPGSRWRTRIPWRDVRDIGSRVQVTIEASELASSGSERWVDDHIISHIPGARDAG